MRDGRLRRHDPGAREARAQVGQVEPVVAVAVRDVDGGEALVRAEGFADPVGQRDALGGREERVDEDGFGGAGDERYDGGLPQADGAVGEDLAGGDGRGVVEVGAQLGWERHGFGWRAGKESQTMVSVSWVICRLNSCSESANTYLYSAQ